jgi:hypothetical protein
VNHLFLFAAERSSMMNIPTQAYRLRPHLPCLTVPAAGGHVRPAFTTSGDQAIVAQSQAHLTLGS